MLRRLIRWARREKARRYVKVLERQMDELHDRQASGEQIARKRNAILAARQRLAALMGLGLALMTQPGCKHPAIGESLELATVTADAAQERCAKKLAHTEGDESQKAVEERRRCLGMPDLGDNQDAADALAHELEQSRWWILTGTTR